MKYKDYIVIDALDITSFEIEVDEFLVQGYKPIGGMTVYDGIFYQAVALETPGPIDDYVKISGRNL